MGKPVRFEQYQDMLARLYPEFGKDKNGESIDDSHRFLTRTVTFMVCDSCNLACKYCYETHKGHKRMSFDTAKKFIDLLLSGEKGFKDYVSPDFSLGIITEFIGGEPFLEIDLIEQICDYFYRRLLELQHPWADHWMISICSNGVLYRDPKVQKFLNKWKNRMSFSVTIDGNKELHDSCRVFPDGSPSYDIAFDAASDWMSRGYYMGSKITIAPGNITHLYDAIVHMVDSGYYEINANCIYEKGWELSHATEFYHQLKKIADYWLDNNLVDSHYLALFSDTFFKPKSEDDLQNWCWGAGTPILTDKGYVPIETLKVGDMVYTEDGTLHKIINTMNHYADNCVSFSTSGGFPLVCTDNHKVFAMPFDYIGNKGKVHYKGFDKYEVKDLTNMRDMIEMSKLKVEGHNHINKAVAMLIGRFIGDGWVDGGYPICCAFDEADELRAMYHEAGIGYTVTSGKSCLTFTSPKYKNIDNDNFNTFITLCDTCGKLSTGKHFPIDWTDWDFESIEALLNGYLSADGYYKKNKNRMSAKTVSYALANDIVLALRTLGYHPTVSVNNHVSNMIQNRLVNCHTQYEISWSLDKSNSKYQKDIDDKTFSSHVTTHRAENQTVYNITVEDNHSYMAGAYMSSNCGGTGAMLACDPDGKLFPCIRYTETSLNGEQEPLAIGDVDIGIGQSCLYCNRIDCLNKIDRRTESTDECFYCPIAEGCSWCSAYNYQVHGTADKRATYICCMHKARALANIYLWSKWYTKTNQDKIYDIYVPKEWALEIISEDEWNYLISLPNVRLHETSGEYYDNYIKR